VSGIIQHADLGVCGGGHHDILPFSKQAVIQIVAAGSRSRCTAHARKLCQELNGLRRVRPRSSVAGGACREAEACAVEGVRVLGGSAGEDRRSSLRFDRHFVQMRAVPFRGRLSVVPRRSFGL
jgi:hypothetical protein